MAISGTEANNFNKFIEIINSIGVVRLDNCTFDTNLVNYMIYIDASSLIYTDYDTDIYWVANVFRQIAFELKNTTITNNYSYLALITHLMGKVTQKVNVDYVNIYNNTAGGNGVLYVDSQHEVTDLETDGAISYVVSQGVRIGAIIDARYINITNVNIKDTFSGYYLIHIGQMPNVLLQNVNLEDSGDGWKGAPNSQAISRIIGDPYSYIEYEFFDYQVGDVSCMYGIHITQPTKITLSNLYVMNSTCQAYSGGIYIADGKGESYINNTSIVNMKNSFSSGAALEMYKMDCNMTIYSLFLYQIEFPNGGGLRIQNSNNFTLDTIDAFSVLAGYEGALFIDKIKYLKISKFACNQCVSLYGNGGALYYSPETIQSFNPSFILEKSTFTSCIANLGSGGALYMESISSNVNITTLLNDVAIDSCQASNGGGIYISNRVSFRSANMSNINIINTHTSKGSSIYDAHVDGTLVLKNYISENNTGLYCGFQGLYSTAGLNLQIFDSRFHNDTCDNKVLFLSSWTENSLVTIQNTTFNHTHPISVYISHVNLNATSLIFTQNTVSLVAADRGSLEVYDTKFKENYGRSAYLTLSSVFECHNCEFMSNYNDSTIAVDQNSRFYIANSKIINNNSTNTGSVANIQSSDQ